MIPAGHERGVLSIPRLSALPLLLVCGLYPLAHQAGLAWNVFHGGAAGMEGALPRQWIDPVWALMACAAAVALWRRAATSRPAALRLWVALAILLAGLAGLRLVTALAAETGFEAVQLAPLAMEFKPLFYLAVAGLWLAWVGPPDRFAFRAGGYALSGLLAAEALARGFAGAGLRPAGSGEINYDACLLIVCLCAGWRPPREDGRNAALTLVTLLGVAASQSRTAMIGWMIAVWLLDRRPAARLTWGGLAFVGLALTLLLRSGLLEAPTEFGLLAVDTERLFGLDRYQMWSAAVRLFLDNPLAALTGFPPGLTLPIDFFDLPPRFAGLIDLQSDDWATEGAHAFNFHAFWLRAALTWGLLPPLGLAVWLSGAVLRAERTGNAALSALVLSMSVMGLTMGLVYLSNVAPPLLLALAGLSGQMAGQMAEQMAERSDPLVKAPGARCLRRSSLA